MGRHRSSERGGAREWSAAAARERPQGPRETAGRSQGSGRLRSCRKTPGRRKAAVRLRPGKVCARVCPTSRAAPLSEVEVVFRQLLSSDGQTSEDVGDDKLVDDDRHEERDVYHPARRYQAPERPEHRFGERVEHPAYPVQGRRGVVGEPADNGPGEEDQHVKLADVEEGVAGTEVEEHKRRLRAVTALLEPPLLLG